MENTTLREALNDFELDGDGTLPYLIGATEKGKPGALLVGAHGNGGALVPMLEAIIANLQPETRRELMQQVTLKELDRIFSKAQLKPPEKPPESDVNRATREAVLRDLEQGE